MSKKSFSLDIEFPQKWTFLDILIDIWAHFSEGSKMRFSEFKCTFGVSGFQGSVAGRGDCNTGVTFGFCKDTVPGAPPLPPQSP